MIFIMVNLRQGLTMPFFLPSSPVLAFTIFFRESILSDWLRRFVYCAEASN